MNNNIDLNTISGYSHRTRLALQHWARLNISMLSEDPIPRFVRLFSRFVYNPVVTLGSLCIAEVRSTFRDCTNFCAPIRCRDIASGVRSCLNAITFRGFCLILHTTLALISPFATLGLFILSIAPETYSPLTEKLFHASLLFTFLLHSLPHVVNVGAPEIRRAYFDIIYTLHWIFIAWITCNDLLYYVV